MRCGRITVQAKPSKDRCHPNQQNPSPVYTPRRTQWRVVIVRQRTIFPIIVFIGTHLFERVVEEDEDGSYHQQDGDSTDPVQDPVSDPTGQHVCHGLRLLALPQIITHHVRLHHGVAWAGGIFAGWRVSRKDFKVQGD